MSLAFPAALALAILANASPTVAQADVEPLSVDQRLERLESRLADQQALLERVAERLEALDAVGSPPTPSAPPAGSVGEAVSAFGGPVQVAVGEVVAEAVAFGAPVTVSGTVSGDAVSFGDDVIVIRTGHVGGDAVSFGGRVRVDPGGRVDGDKVALSSEDAPSGSHGLSDFAARGSAWMHHMVRRTVLLLCLAGIGVLLLGLFPEKVRNVARGIERHPIRYGLAGVLLTGTGLCVSTILALTLIGIPLSGFVLLLLGLAWLLGFVALGQVLGDILPVPAGARGRVGAFLVGVCLLGALSFVPYLGKLLVVASLFPCVGAAIGTRFGASES